MMYLPLSLYGCGGQNPGSDEGSEDTSQPTELQLVGQLNVSDIEINGQSSSSRLSLSWTLEDQGFDSLHIRMVNHLGEPTRSLELGLTDHEVEINQLRSDTLYLVSLEACIGNSCGYLGPMEKRTTQEVWQLAGEGQNYEGITPVIADGNTKPWVIRLGTDAPEDLEGRLQLYYDPLTQSEKGVKIGFIEEAPTPNPNTWMPFSEIPGYGLLRDAPGGPDLGEGTGPATFQAIPLSKSSGGNVAIIFEGELNEEDGIAVYRIDSVDGVVGRDFHPGEETQCEAQDFGPDGACPASLLLHKGSLPDNLLSSVRQSKVLVPIQDEGTWNEEAGSRMLTTLHFTDERCSNSFFWGGYAVYDGDTWSIEVDEEGCPKGWPGMQAPEALHMGNGLYRAYFNHNEMIKQRGASVHDFVKPMKTLYADARKTGDPDIVEFEDWETIDQAHDITILWPDGTALTEAEESRLDDHVIMTPTGHMDHLALYTNFSCVSTDEDTSLCPPIIAMAYLLNP
jgi:hypothetical protein